ncbi:hypothetical protein Psta_4659 [Pirellula staleyi DSM 6068]|uniref:Uncharacterized protein n=1 Tax=Pirellula staleyi (strain ATCC 27377 / DSM 6068 / ICPB 4128) TaxID=530564 RepID=D2R7X0_PIRSD|nr:hypothetical protein [Pirellula staleyi]ADB19301.1 hypothetical protein Psta_4659 [Pirellula staleyi DSM 6068]
MTSPNRAAILAKVHKVLKKYYKPIIVPTERTVLEHLLYACCLESARYEAADEAFAKLKELFFDWNEVRVTTVTELAEVMSGVADPQAAGNRIKKVLQSVFEANYSFDLEPLKKQNLGKAEKDLEKIAGSTGFVRAFVTQQALGGHAIPVTEEAVTLLYAVGVINDAEADKHQIPGMERAIPKNKGAEFGSLMHQLAADFKASPGSSKLRGILAEIDPDYKERLGKRVVRVEETNRAIEEAARLERLAPKPIVPPQMPNATAGKSGGKPGGKPSEKGGDKAAEKAAAKEPGPKDASKGAPKAPPKPAGKEPAKPVIKVDDKKGDKKPKPPAPKSDGAGKKSEPKQSNKGLTKKKPK